MQIMQLKTALWAAGGEKIDIYYVGTTVPFSQFVSDGMIIPITDVLEERGQTILEKSGDLMKAFTVDGEIYAIPQNLYCATASGIDYNGDMFDELGMELPQEWNMQTLTDIGYKLKEVNPDYYLMAKNGATDATEMSIFYGMDNFGSGTGVYGTLMNPETNTKFRTCIQLRNLKSTACIILNGKKMALCLRIRLSAEKMPRIFTETVRPSASGLV